MSIVSPSEVERIRELAVEQSVAPLSADEIAYIQADVTYNWYAVLPQMPRYVASDRALATKALKEAVTEERYTQIEAFTAWLQEDPNEADDAQ